MAGRKKDRGLGRGLSALMSDLGATEEAAPVVDAAPDALVDAPRDPDAPSEQPRVRNVAISRLQRNPDQPRKHFERGAMDDLIASIQQKGVLQPVLVRPIPDGSGPDRGQYQIVAGERRWQASLKAGLTSIPVIVRELSDRDVLEIGVIENVQRADLNPMEEAIAYQRLISEFGRTQAEIATTIGKSRAHVANTVRLTGLTARGRDLLVDGTITAGHARMLLTAEDPDALAEAIVSEGWSVREAERYIKAERNHEPARRGAARQPKPADIVALEQRIRDRTGYAADVRHKGAGGEIRIKYKDLDDMEALLARLGLMG